MKEIKILLFAELAEIVGKREIKIFLKNENTAYELIEKLVKTYPAVKSISESLLVAVDTKQIPLDAKIGKVEEEIAIFPPVSGG